MGYFSNGTENDLYQAEFCERCMTRENTMTNEQRYSEERMAANDRRFNNAEIARAALRNQKRIELSHGRFIDLPLAPEPVD